MRILSETKWIYYVYRVLGRSGLSLKDSLLGSSLTLGEALMAPTVIYVKQVICFRDLSTDSVSISALQICHCNHIFYFFSFVVFVVTGS